MNKNLKERSSTNKIYQNTSNKIQIPRERVEFGKSHSS